MASLKQSLKLPGASKLRGKLDNSSSSSPSSRSPNSSINSKELESLLTKGPFIDLSPPAYNLESDDFLLHCPNVIKELDLSFNSLIQLSSLKNLHKLKRLFVDNNVLVSLMFHGLSNLVLLSAVNNRLVTIEDTTDLKKLVQLDLCGNRIVHGFEELAKLKTLRVLDLSSNTLDMPLQNFMALLLEPLKRLPKLEYLSFIDNPIETKIPEFRCFVIQELPRLKYLDWLPITKEERIKATRLESEGLWASKSLPPKDIPSPRAASSSTITRHSVSYNKDTATEATKNSVGDPTSEGTAARSGSEGGDATTVLARSAGAPPPAVASAVRGLPTSASTPSPVLRRNVAPLQRESSQFNGDFSALDAMIEEFEGASQELLLSRSTSLPAPGSVTSPAAVHNRSYTSFDGDIANISDIPPPVATPLKSSLEDPLTELLTEFESITPSHSSRSVSGDNTTPVRSASSYDTVVSPIQAPPRPTDKQFTEALAMTDVTHSDNSYEKYPEDAQILSNIDKVIESTPVAEQPRQKKFATNVVRSDFPDAYFADELEAALSELEASLDFPELESVHDHGIHANGTSSNVVASQDSTRSDFNLTSLSEIESTLQELASTTSTPSKGDTTDGSYSSPYSTPTHINNNNNLNTSRSSPYTSIPSNSNRTNTPLPSQSKPAVQRTQSESKPSPKPTTPTTPTVKKPASPKAPPTTTSSNSSFSHSFASSFDPLSNPSSPTAPATAALPDSPKIRSRLSQTFMPEEIAEDQFHLQTPQEEDEEDVLDKLISSLALESSPVLDEPQVPTMLRARRPLSAAFVPPVSHPALATLPSPAQLPPSIIKNQELQHQQQKLLHQQERERRLHEERERRMQEEHEQQQLAMKRQLNVQQQQMEQLQQQQLERERRLQEERDRERLHREQLAYREQILQRELQQQKEIQFQKELLLQTELRQKEMQAEALLQQQKQQALFLQQQALVQQQQQVELAARRVQQEEERERLINMTAQIVSYNFLTITDKLGGGSFGDVHMCVMRYPHSANLAPKDVTVKKIRMQRFNDNFLEQFSKEVQSFSALPLHPNIVPLVGGCVEVVICTIHDYVPGISLAETKGLSELGSNLTLQIARSIIAGLQELHKYGKVHRSLKPSNVLLANPDQSTPLRTVKLRDYGFAAIKDAILKAGQAPSPYLAPEILTSSPSSSTPAVDTFAFGMTLWFMFTGEQPFPGLHPKKMAESLASGIRPNISPNTPAALAKLIAACWNTEPNARPPLDTVARILNMSETKLFAGAAPLANPAPQQFPLPLQPPQTQTQQLSPLLQSHSQQSHTQSLQQSPHQEAAQGNRISTVLSRVVDTLISKAANQIPKACKLLEVINKPEVIPVMIEKAIPKYLVDMLKNPQLESTDVEAILRTLQILSDHENFAQTLCASDMINPVLTLVRPHTAVANISRASYAIRNPYILPAARVVHAIIAHPSLLIALRDRAEMETLIALTDSLKDSPNHLVNQSNDDATVQILGVLNQMLSTPKARSYFINTSGLDAALFHVNSSYPPLRAQVVELLFLFAVNFPSPPSTFQDAFARNPAAVINLVSCISTASDMSQLRSHAAKVIHTLAQLPWQTSTSSPAPVSGSSRSTPSGSSRSNMHVTHAAVTASLQAAVPKLISTIGSCKPGENDDLVIDICGALSAILDNANLNASVSISKLDQLAVFALLQSIPQTSPILQPILHLANHIVHLRDDTANLHGELAMCVPQLIATACSPSLPVDVQTQALDFIAHIATDGQHATTLVEAGILRPLMQQLTQSPKASSTIFSLQILASILSSLFQDHSPSFAAVCGTILASDGVAVLSRFVVNTSTDGSEQSDVEAACEWALATLTDLSRDEETRTAMIAANTLALLADVGMSREMGDRVTEGALACLSSFCAGSKYYQPLCDSRAVATIVSRLSSSDNVVALALKCVLQLVKEPAGRELLVTHNAAALLETVATSPSLPEGNPTLPLAARKVLSLLKT